MNKVEKSFELLKKKLAGISKEELNSELEKFKIDSDGPTIKEFLFSKRNYLNKIGQFYVSKTKSVVICNEILYKENKINISESQSLEISFQSALVKSEYNTSPENNSMVYAA